MPEYIIKEQRLGYNTQTLIKDATGHPLYLLMGHWGNKNDVLSLYLMDGTLVASVKQTSLLVGRRFDLFVNFNKIGVMKKRFNWPGDVYYIRQLHWTVFGDIAHHHYSIYHFHRPIMHLDKRPILTNQDYCLHVFHEQDAPICICIAAVMDYWLYNRQKELEPLGLQPVFA